MLYAAWPLLRRSGRVLLEAAPEGIDPGEIGAALRGHPGVTDVHDLHVWEISSGFPALSAHVLVAARRGLPRDPPRARGVLHDRFGIDHTTLQVEHTADRLLSIGRLRSGRCGPLSLGPRVVPTTAPTEAMGLHHSGSGGRLFCW